MKLIKTALEFYDWRSKNSSSLGFVPTMGALHEGHMSLVNASKALCEVSVVSIFVNPTQFSKSEDFGSYPKTIKKDIENLTALDVDVLFLPDEKEMYKKVDSVVVPESKLFKKLEGKSRPHFFYGVTKIVSKLFNVIKPSHAFFGEKDMQQLIVVKQMVVSMGYKIKLVGCPTVRDKNGLALSSRNQYLSKKNRLEASLFYASLQKITALIDAGEKSCPLLKKEFKKNILKSSKTTIDYISIASKNTLDELDVVEGDVLISAAIFFTDVRLIDNISYHSSTK